MKGNRLTKVAIIADQGPLSAAEKQRWYRAGRDADPERRGKIISQGKGGVQESQISAREHQQQCRKWSTGLQAEGEAQGTTGTPCRSSTQPKASSRCDPQLLKVWFWYVC